MVFLENTKKIEQEIIAIRRDLHMHPELGNQEFRTTGRICEILESYGIEYKQLNPTGVVADIHGKRDGKVIALRADIDALPIKEATGLLYSSVNEGVMHACGHDTHTAMLLGAAKVLESVKDELNGTVRLIFQPDEETAAGAARVIRQGVLDGVDTIFGLHIISMDTPGKILVGNGPSHAATDRFRIRVHGIEGHAASPHMGCDALYCASSIVVSLQQIVSRHNDPFEPLVVTVGSFHSGKAFNNLSGEAVLEGTCRCYDVELHHSLPDKMRSVVSSVAASCGCTAELEYDMLTEPLISDSRLGELVWKAAEKLNPDPMMIAPFIHNMGGEDFSEYTTVIPGAYVGLYAGGDYPGHSEKCTFDESVLKIGSALYCQVAWDYLNQ